MSRKIALALGGVPPFTSVRDEYDQPAFGGPVSRFFQKLHNKIFHRWLYVDWPYETEPVIEGYCARGCGWSFRAPASALRQTERDVHA